MCADYKPSQCFTQTQIIVESSFPSSQANESIPPKDPNLWGRLLPLRPCFKQVNLNKDVLTFGRRLECDVQLTSDSDVCSASAYSGIQFKIKREFSLKTGSQAFLEDLSSNGTFINGEKIGKGRIQALKNNQEIALAKKENIAFIYIDLDSEDNTLPPQIKRSYMVTKTLGVGAYGEVKLVFEKETNQRYALKVIPKKKFTVHGRNQMNLQEQILSEVNILKNLDHPCIVKTKEVIDTPDCVYIVLELVEGGELFDKVVSIGQYDEPTAKLLFYQMVVAIKYLHDKGISHRDLKPENILLCSADENETLIKVTDFGLSKFFDATQMMKTFCGTPNYLAPEVLMTKGEGAYTNKIDNWSLGVILYICLSGYPPFTDENTSASLEKQITQGMYDFPSTFWSGVSRQAIDVIKRLLCLDPNKRATLEQILEHPWIKADHEMKQKAEKLMYGGGKRENDNDSESNGDHQSNESKSKRVRR